MELTDNDEQKSCDHKEVPTLKALAPPHNKPKRLHCITNHEEVPTLKALYQKVNYVPRRFGHFLIYKIAG